MTKYLVNPLPYDNSNPNLILDYAKKLKGKTFEDILSADPNLTEDEKDRIRTKYNNPKYKWSFWNLIEESYFFYKKNNDSEADFPEAWVELKVSPYFDNEWKIRGKERISLTMINFNADYNKTFEESHIYDKCSLLLLIFYLYKKEQKKMDYIMNYIDLFQFPEEDFEILKSDYNIIIEKIKRGEAHLLSEWDTKYLWACRKWQKTKKWTTTITTQPFSNEPAKTRAFCLKVPYVTSILNRYIINNKHTYWNIIKDLDILKKTTLEEYVLSKLKLHYWEDADELLLKYWINPKRKDRYAALANIWIRDIFNINKEDIIDEFEKANIEVKTVRLDSKWKPCEAMSFPAFKYLEIIDQKFEESDLYDLFANQKFLLIVYKYDDTKNLKFEKAMFWNIPILDIEWPIKDFREETVKRIKSGKYNNLPKESENMIMHVRPHAWKSSDTFTTPDWKSATKKCFWFNKSYIQEQIEKGGN